MYFIIKAHCAFIFLLQHLPIHYMINTIRQSIGCEQMKNKSTKRKTQSTYKKQTNAYSLEDYRNKRERSGQTDQGYTTGQRARYDSQSQRQDSQNPYRNQYYSPNQQTGPTRSYINPYDAYKPNQGAATSTPNKSRPHEHKQPEQRRQEIKKKNKLTREQILKQKKRRRSQQLRKVIMLAGVVTFASYGVIRIVDLFTYPPISYETVKQGVIDNTEELVGLIVREEKIVTSKKEGDVHYIIGEGEKVAKGGDVCFVNNDLQIEQTMNQMNSLDESIYNMQDKRSDLSYFQAELHQLNLEVASEINQFYYGRYWDNPNQVYALRKQLEKVVQNRTSIYINDQTELTQGMQVDREALQGELKTYQHAHIAEESGLVSYYIDQFEDVLTPETLEQMTYSSYKGFVEQTSQGVIGAPVLETTVDAPMYKLIEEDKWSIVTYMKTENAVQYEVGKTYPLYFDEGYGKPILFKLADQLEEEKQTKLVFETLNQPADFLDKRQVGFTIGQNKATGLKIPLKAIVEKNIMPIPIEYVVTQDHNKGVYKKIGENTTFVPINVQYADEEFVYILQEIDSIASVQLGQMIKHPEKEDVYTLDKVDTVQGVYTINGSYAKFKKIKVVMVNDNYAILSNDADTGLKEFDQIISNPRHIKEDQLVRYMNIQNE